MLNRSRKIHQFYGLTILHIYVFSFAALLHIYYFSNFIHDKLIDLTFSIQQYCKFYLPKNIKKTAPVNKFGTKHDFNITILTIMTLITATVALKSQIKFHVNEKRLAYKSAINRWCIDNKNNIFFFLFFF